MAEADSENFASLPANYVSIVQLQERWLKEKQRKQQEKEEKEKREEEEEEEEEKKKKQREDPVPQNLQKGQNHSGYGKSHYSKIPVGKNVKRGENHSGNHWREVGLIAKEPKSKVVEINAPEVEDGGDGKKKKKGYFEKRKPRVERDMAKVSLVNVAKEQMMTLVAEGVDGTREKIEKKKGYFGKRKPRVERDGTIDMGKVSIIDVAKEEIMAVDTVGKGEIELSKGKNQLNGEDGEVKEKGLPLIHRISNNVPLSSGISRLSKNKEVKEVDVVCMVQVVGENKVDREIPVRRSKVGFSVKKDSRRMVEQSVQENNVEKKEVSADVKERTNEKVSVRGEYCKYGNLRRDVTGDVANVSTIRTAEGEILTVVSVGNGGKELSKGVNQLKSEINEINEVGSINMVEVVGENKVDKEIPIQRSTVGFRGKQGSWRMMGIKVGEVGDKADSLEQSRQEHNVEKEVVPADVKERTKKKVSVTGAFRKYGHSKRDVTGDVANVSASDMANEEITTVVSVGNGGKKLSKGINQLNSDNKEINEVCTVYSVEVVGQSKVDKEIPIQRSTAGFRGKQGSWRMMGIKVGEVGDKADSVEEPRKENNAEVVGQSKVDKEIPIQRSTAGFRGKQSSWRMMGIKVGEIGDKADSVEQPRKENNAEEEVFSADVKERTNEKVSGRGAFRKYGHLRRDVRKDVANVSTSDLAEEEITTAVSVGNGGKELSKGINQLKRENKEIDEFCTVYRMEVVGESKVDKEIPTQKSTVMFGGKQGSKRIVDVKVGEVGDEADSIEQSRKENNAEDEVVSDDVKERTNEKERVQGGNGYDDKRGDIPLVAPGVNVKIESNFWNLSLSDRRYGYGRSSHRYVDKWRYGNPKRYEPRRMLKRRNSSFVWVKKGESLDGNVAEIETQVDSSSQNTSQSQLCSK